MTAPIVPLPDVRLDVLADRARSALGVAAEVPINPDELARLVGEVRRHREIAHALISDEPDSHFAGELAEVRRNVAAAVERNRRPKLLELRARLERRREAAAAARVERDREWRALGPTSSARSSFHYESGREDALELAIALLDELAEVRR